ncbi:MAG: polyphosphate kinase 1 [Lysobacterales bacterium]
MNKHRSGRDLRDPTLYINRELSQLEFNARVLAQAQDESVPLLDRLRFLCICSTNIDEFFEIRVAALKQQIAFGGGIPAPDGLSPLEAFNRVRSRTLELVAAQYQLWNRKLRPALRRRGIRVLMRNELNARQRSWLQRYFEDEIQPVLSPLGLDPAHPFPRILNKSLNIVVLLKGRDAFGREGHMAVVRAPRSLPRVIRLPGELGEGAQDFVLLSSVLLEFVADLFPGMEVRGSYQFRVTRNSELIVDDDDAEDLADAIKDELRGRGYAQAVRLEVADNCPKPTLKFLTANFELHEDDIYLCHGPVNLSRVGAIYDMIDRPDLKYPAFTPRLQPRLVNTANLFEAISEGDVLLHHPYDSFMPVLDLLRQASVDPGVLAIKQTLYRTGKDSPLIGHLIDAARAGKDVTVVIELRARFDEEANLGVANRLQEAGVQVVYGVVGYKTHAKMLLIVRRELSGLRRYVHLATGNYHAGTARSYTDIGLLTCHPEISEDVHKVFLQIAGLGPVLRLTRLLQSPFTLHQRLLGMIQREADHATAGRPAAIRAKINHLNEPQVIEALYGASQAGVRIELVVRGTCCLRPGIRGVSERISVRSLVGRFLEHSRVYWFENDGNSELWCSSADWLDRNLLRRIELCFPILDADLARRVLDETIESCLADNQQAWQLHADGHYSRIDAGDAPAHAAQQSLLARLC